MSSTLLKKRQHIHQQVVQQISQSVGSMLLFVVIFSVLLVMSNWAAYSLILQDMIDPTAMEQRLSFSQAALLHSEAEQEALQQQLAVATPDFSLEPSSNNAEAIFSASELGQLHPPEMRLSIPKLFDGTLPVQNVDVADFSFADLYASENKLQEALREGVLQYPYTANPNQFGNVFITGHSSYYPWDKGRYKEVFALLHKLEVGDRYSIFYDGQEYIYQVRDKYEIQPDDVSVLEQPIDRKESTLMTCTPVGTTLKRLIIKADLVEVV